MPSAEILLGKYVLHERIHLGERSETFLATESQGKDVRQLALKRILSAAASNKDYVQAFVESYRSSKSLEHAGICPIFDCGSDAELTYVAREYLEGKDLRDLARRHVVQRRVLPPPVVLYIASQICQALEHVHKQRNGSSALVHANLTPNNVLIGFNGQVKLINFAPGETSSVLKPTGYLTPEHEAGKSVDARTDVFSVGLALFELLTNKHPFPDGLGKQCASPSSVRSSVSAELDPIVKRALSLDPEQRYPSVSELAKDLDAFSKKSNEEPAQEAALASLMKRIFPNQLRIERERASRLVKGHHEATGEEKSTGEQAAVGAAQLPVAPTSSGKPLHYIISIVVGIAVGAAIFFAVWGMEPDQPKPDPSVVAKSKVGTLLVKSKVPVFVYIDGDKTRLVPPIKTEIKPGPHELTIIDQQDSTKRFKRKFTVKPGQTVDLNLTKLSNPS